MNRSIEVEWRERRFIEFDSTAFLALIVLCSTIAQACEKRTEPSSSSEMSLDMQVSDASTSPSPDMTVDSELDGDPTPELPTDMMVIPDMALDQPPPRADFCESEGLPITPIRAGDGGFNFGDIAGDFTVQTLRGSWTMSAEWSGCESYVFVVYFPDLRQNPSGPWVSDQLWESDFSGLVNTPINTHYFFLSFEEDPGAREARMADLYNRMIRSLNAGDQIPERLHFVTDRATEVEGSVGEFMSDYLDFVFDPSSLADLGDRGMAQSPLPFIFGIDRLQRWDSGGSLDEIVGRPMIWQMATYLGDFFNHIASMYERAASDGALEVSLVGGRVSERVIITTVELPSAEMMTSFDTLELDVSVTCPHRNVFECSEWDRIARIERCVDPADSECAERYEIARWITPYWRRGERRWIWDASPFLGELAEGGSQTFRVEMGPTWERATERDAQIKLRLRDRGSARRALGATRVFVGGEFGPMYNTRDPLTFTPPPEAVEVELVVILSGHGQTSQDNCAEWCDHRHHFTLNEVTLPTLEHPGEVGSIRGCAELASQGVSPGQFGNWAPERAYWCPGLPVTPISVDLTEQVRFGETNTLSYRATLGADLEPRGGDIALSAYVVYWGAVER